MSDWPECDASLNRAHQSGSTWNYCSVPHCNDLQSYNHSYCNCTGQFSVYPWVQNGVCMSSPGSLIPISEQQCFCCCSCLAYDTPIAVSESEVKAVQDFSINDLVLVATDTSLKSWIQKPVMFSAGTGAKGKNKLIKVHFGDQTKGLTVGPETFISQQIDKAASAAIFNVLSTPPNAFIGKDGMVNLTMVRETTPDDLSRLLNLPIFVAESVYDILSIDANYLLVTGIQPFMMPDKTFKQASKLVPGKDQLVLADGTTTPIVSLEVGMFEKGIHHIATSTGAATSPDNHLLLANGIVVGDYALQISLASNTNNGFEDVHASAPAFGSKEYADTHTHLEATPFSAHAAKKVVHKAHAFHVLNVNNSALIPRDALSYITRSQAKYLLENAPIYPASNNLAEPDVRYLFRLFSGFFPDITFYYDHNNMMPNAYAFTQYDKKFIVITLGWTLVEGLYFQGIAMTLANLVNRLNQTSVQPGDNPVGKADYDTFSLFLSLFYFPDNAAKNYNLGLAQIKTVFGYIKRYRKPIGKIGLNCRIKALEASIAARPLPHCAGGPPDPALQVLKATAAQRGSGKPVISIQFNLEVDPVSAAGLGNYLLDPGATSFSAEVDPDNPKMVNLVADIEAGKEYYISVTGVVSIDDQPMVVGKNGARFTLA